MKFKKEYLQNLVCNDLKPEEGEVIEDTITDHRRWSVTHTIIFRAENGKYYTTYYNVGATECQEESPFEYEDDEIECSEVRQVEKTIKVWEQVK